MNDRTWNEIRDQSGVVRKLACLPPPKGLVLGTAPRVTLDDSEIIEFEYEGSPVKVKNQGQYGACNGHAAATSVEWARWIAGLTHVDLSAWFIYAILCNGIDQGSSIAEALDLLRKTGTCPEPEVPYGTINPRRIPSEAQKDAPRFRIEVGARLAGFRDLMTATSLGRPGNFSICADAFGQRLDADGCPAVSNGPCNHAVTYGLGIKKCRDGQYAIKCQNSWDITWGDNGFFWIKERNIYRSAYFDAYEVTAVEYDPQDPDNPPSAPRMARPRLLPGLRAA